MQSADFGLAGSASGVISDEAEVVMKPAPALEFENVSSERAVGLFDALVAARARTCSSRLSRKRLRSWVSHVLMPNSASSFQTQP